MFRIRIHLIRIWIQHYRQNTYPDPEFWWPKIEKNLQLKKRLYFLIKNCYLPFPRPSKGRPSYRRSLQPSKENIQHFKAWNFQNVSIFWVIFALLDTDPDSESGFRIRIRIRTFGYGSVDLIGSGSVRIRIRNNDYKACSVTINWYRCRIIDRGIFKFLLNRSISIGRDAEDRATFLATGDLILYLISRCASWFYS